MTDDELYRAYLDGDAGAGDRLMLLCSDALTAYLAAFGHSMEDAEELMLDCFSVILVDRPRIQAGNFRAYLFKVARNKAKRLWRLRLKRQEFRLEEAAAGTSDSPEASALKQERGVILDRCLMRIPAQYREALWLIYNLDMSYAQAAQVLGCDRKKLDNLLKNGKQRLREELEREGITKADL